MVTYTALVKALQDTNYKVRWSAVESLAKLGGPAAISGLVKALADKSRDVQMFAVEALGELKAQKAVNPLLRLLTISKDELVRANIVQSLGWIGDSRGTPCLKRRLETDASPLVRGYSAHSLGQLRSANLGSTLERALNKDQNSWVRMILQAELYRLGRTDRLPEVLRYLESKDYRIRCATANTLVDLCNKSNYSAIVHALQAARAHEKTIAARSSIDSALACLKREILKGTV